MAYSELDKPIYPNSRDAHFYPEENDYIPGHRGDNITYHHPNYLRYPKKFNYLSNLDVHDKTPIYVHPMKRLDNFSTKNLCYTDILKMRGVEVKKGKKTPKTLINKLEETYWSNWKPAKESGTEEVISVFPEKKQNKVKKNKAEVNEITSGKSIEIQTELSAIVLTKKEEEKLNTKLDQVITEEVCKIEVCEAEKDENLETGSLKHIDSLIVLKKKKGEPKEKNEPKCIKLFRKINKGSIPSNRSYIRGGSYPLRQQSGIAELFSGKKTKKK